MPGAASVKILSSPDAAPRDARAQILVAQLHAAMAKAAPSPGNVRPRKQAASAARRSCAAEDGSASKMAVTVERAEKLTAQLTATRTGIDADSIGRKRRCFLDVS